MCFIWFWKHWALFKFSLGLNCGFISNICFILTIWQVIRTVSFSSSYLSFTHTDILSVVCVRVLPSYLHCLDKYLDSLVFLAREPGPSVCCMRTKFNCSPNYCWCFDILFTEVYSHYSQLLHNSSAYRYKVLLLLIAYIEYFGLVDANHWRLWTSLFASSNFISVIQTKG